MTIIIKDKSDVTLCVVDKPHIPSIGDTIRVNNEITYHKVVDRIFEWDREETLDFVFLIVA